MINVAVIGAIKQGKSTLINTILDYKINNKTGKYPEVAAIVKESGSTTQTPAPYSNPLLEGIVVWDMPGIDGFCHKMDEYLDKFEINSDKFDFFVVVISGEITTDAGHLIRELYKREMPFYLVRTHVDETIRKGQRLRKEERDVFNGVRDELHQQLHLLGQSFEPINGSVNIKYELYLVDGLERDRYDMKKLLEDIKNDLP
ncbi:T-cell-specific guanine nucleotide triphosphate-binding protein 2-like [Convolutriloba macropyga]|uniref:T-cell-specific guanine nucleotide triphosphate-binding protein 2-like n=1 Tax=Convolutriloba macropyga TaxID=536237 RepID=UPI003F51F5CB